jgi:hypothetical protein
MRLGIVRGHITLSPAVESFRSRTLAIVEPVTMENLVAKNGKAGGKALIAVDELGSDRPDGSVHRGTRGGKSILARAGAG